MQVPGVQEVVDPLATFEAGLGLCDLILMMWKAEIDTLGNETCEG